jgi:hypothetical protein
MGKNVKRDQCRKAAGELLMQNWIAGYTAGMCKHAKHVKVLRPIHGLYGVSEMPFILTVEELRVLNVD